jgi:hypothetical protein
VIVIPVGAGGTVMIGTLIVALIGVVAPGGV